jgi:ArsR family transcriptional regulator
VPTNDIQALARSFQALSDKDRLRILCLIANTTELCNAQLEESTGFLASKISRHLSLLRQTAWILGRREGTWIHYSLNPDAPAPGAQWLRTQASELLKAGLEPTPRSANRRPTPRLVLGEEKSTEEESAGQLQTHLL